MSGIWDSLTVQGKLVLLAGVGVIILVFSLVFRGSADNGDGGGQVIVRSPTIAIARTVSPSTTAVAGGQISATATLAASNSGAPASPTSAPPTATSAPNTATPAVVVSAPTSTPVPPVIVPPTSTPEPPLPPPTATTAAVNCTALATVSNPAPPVGSTVTVTGQLSCGGRSIAGSQMAALFSFSNTTATCGGVSDSAGIANCSLRLLEASPNQFVPVSACFTYQGEVFCGKTGFTTQ